MSEKNPTSVAAAAHPDKTATPDKSDTITQKETAVEETLTARHAVKVGPVNFLIPQQVISEVVDNARYCRLPGSPPYLLGMGSIRAITFPVFDMHFLCGVKSPEKPVVLLINFEIEPAAITVDQLPSVIQISASQKTQTLPPLRPNLKRYIEAAYQAEELCVEFSFIDFFESSGCAKQNM